AIAMRPMILGIEHGVGRDLARERVGRVRHACEQAHLAALHSWSPCEREPRLLLEYVEHRLQGHDRPVVYRAVAFLDPPDRRTERYAELAYLAFLAELAERLPHFVVDDWLDAGVVQLQEVDAVRAQPPQRVLHLRAYGLRTPVVWPLGLPRESALGADVVADLGREHDVVARR